MSHSSVSASRVADYFFIAGLHDEHIVPTLENARKHQQLSDNDSVYYQQQERALNDLNRPRIQTVISDPTPLASFPDKEQNSLLGVLDHVQHVIDNFDKERDIARDNVIAVVHERYKRSESEKTGIHRANTRKWRSPSDPKIGKAAFMQNLFNI